MCGAQLVKMENFPCVPSAALAALCEHTLLSNGNFHLLHYVVSAVLVFQEHLSLVRNKLRDLHSDVAHLPNLRVVNCRHNRLKNSAVPPDLFKLDDLSVLVRYFKYFNISQFLGRTAESGVAKMSLPAVCRCFFHRRRTRLQTPVDPNHASPPPPKKQRQKPSLNLSSFEYRELTCPEQRANKQTFGQV